MSSRVQTVETLRPPTTHRASVAALVVIYSALLTAVYQLVIAPRFDYLAFVNLRPDPLVIIVSGLTCGVLGLLLPQNVSRPSDLGRILVFFFITVPAVMIPPHLSGEWEGTVIEAQMYGIVAFLVLTALLSALSNVEVPTLRLPNDLTLWLLIGVGLLCVLALGSSYGFSIQIHSLTTVYDQREVYSEGGGGSGIVGIAVGLLQNVLAPIFVVIGLHRRSWLIFSFGFFFLLYIYTITGLKSALIGIVFVIGVYAIAHAAKSAGFTKAWSKAAVVFVTVSWLTASTPGLSVVIDLVVRRILVMQGMLTYNYVEVFKDEDPTYFSHTILGTFAQRPFEGRPPEIVGDLLFGRSVNANSSFVADGYVSGKLLGILVATVVIALFFALLDALTRDLDTPVALAVTSMAIYITTQSGVITALLNHGGIALLGCLWLAGSSLAVRAAPPDERSSAEGDRAPGQLAHHFGARRGVEPTLRRPDVHG